ncbi:MAG: MarR family winged helix-turn-helix transcriptional regulator [Opitutales bacterium]
MTQDPKLEQQRYREAVNHCVAFNVKKLARHVSSMYDHALRPYGITSGQFVLLAVLKSEGPCSVKELAEHLAVERTVMSRNVRPLIDEGLIEMTQSSTDRRYRSVSLTEKGAELLVRATEGWQQANGVLRKRLGSEGFDDMLVEVKRLDQQLN